MQPKNMRSSQLHNDIVEYAEPRFYGTPALSCIISEDQLVTPKRTEVQTKQREQTRRLSMPKLPKPEEVENHKLKLEVRRRRMRRMRMRRWRSP